MTAQSQFSNVSRPWYGEWMGQEDQSKGREIREEHGDGFADWLNLRERRIQGQLPDFDSVTEQRVRSFLEVGKFSGYRSWGKTKSSVLDHRV